MMSVYLGGGQRLATRLLENWQRLGSFSVLERIVSKIDRLRRDLNSDGPQQLIICQVK